MNEQETYPLIKKYFESKGFKYTGQPDRGDIVPLEQIRLDGHAFKNGEPPEIYWIEAKGDDVNLAGCLADLGKLCFITYTLGGKGLFVVPTESFSMLKEHMEFISEFQSNTGFNINVLNIETEQVLL